MQYMAVFFCLTLIYVNILSLQRKLITTAPVEDFTFIKISSHCGVKRFFCWFDLIFIFLYPLSPFPGNSLCNFVTHFEYIISRALQPHWQCLLPCYKDPLARGQFIWKARGYLHYIFPFFPGPLSPILLAHSLTSGYTNFHLRLGFDLQAC